MEGSVNICIICNRCLYARSVFCFHQNNYEMDMDKVLCSFTQQEHVCRTCDCYLKKKKIPPQVLCKELNISSVPSEDLLISRGLLFKKVTIMPKGCFPKLEDTVCSIPVETNDIAHVLPRGVDSNDLIFVTIKQKLSYRGTAYLEAVSPEAAQLALVYLKQNNPFYHEIKIGNDNILMNYLI